MKNLIIDFDNTLAFQYSLLIAFLKIPFYLNIYVLILFPFNKVFVKKFLYEKGYMPKQLKFNDKIMALAQKENAFIISGSYEKYLLQILNKKIKKNRIIGTSSINLTGANKCKFILSKFGSGNYDYIGDSFSDIKIWKYAKNPYTVKRYFLYKLFIKNLKKIE